MASASGMFASRRAFVLCLFVGLVFLSAGYFLGQQQGYKCKTLEVQDSRRMTAEVAKLSTYTRRQTGGDSELVHRLNVCKLQLATRRKQTEVDSELQRLLNTCKLQRMKDEKPKHDDPDLVEYARKSLLIAPNYSLSYKLSGAAAMNSDTSQYGQVGVIRKIFDEIIKPPAPYKGFFIEAGAYDGVFLSNTLWFEREWNWAGLLIESNSRNFAKLVATNRKAWFANVCLSTSQHPGFLTYYESVGDQDGAAFNGLVKLPQGQGGLKKESQMYCVPLYTLLLALNQTVVDVFSLDVEGAELTVLQTIPFDKVHIKVLTIETEWIEGGNGPSRIKAFMNEKGYKLYKIAYDSIFVHSKYLPKDFKDYLYVYVISCVLCCEFVEFG